MSLQKEKGVREAIWADHESAAFFPSVCLSLPLFPLGFGHVERREREALFTPRSGAARERQFCLAWPSSEERGGPRRRRTHT